MNKDSTYQMIGLLLISLLLVGVAAERSVYVLEGKDVTIECPIPRSLPPTATLYWLGPKNNTMDNYAVGNETFHPDYTVRWREGRYDLTIRKASYNRNNGMLSCRIVHTPSRLDETISTNLTVLIKPGSPIISPQHVTATQGKEVNIVCSSRGGSPDPQIVWLRTRDRKVMQSVWRPGGGREHETTATLSFTPQKEDDGAEFMCEVRSRALSEGEKMAATVRLDVNYYPIVRIEPSNPVRVVRGNSVTLTCQVDAKPEVQHVRWRRRTRFMQSSPLLRINNASVDDGGRYICEADNNLGRTGEAEVTIEILHEPEVSVVSRDVSMGDDVIVGCNYTANPQPDVVYWTKTDDPKFRQNGDYLQLKQVMPKDHGEYVCHAINRLNPTGKEEVMVEGNGTMSLRIRHAPGKSYILPHNPVAVEKGSIVLTCKASPPGYPEPMYRWWRDGQVMEIGQNFSIPIASQYNEGEYHCQPYNSLGNGTRATENLRVYAPPRILEELQPTAKYRRERTDVRLSCRAQGKPKPVAKWLKDGEELRESDGLYSINVRYTELNGDQGYQVESTLVFEGPERNGLKTLRPEDRGRYECMFDNEALNVSSKQLVQVQHSPAIAHRRKKVAADPNESVQLICKMRAFPTPSFEWRNDKGESFESSIKNYNYEVIDSNLGDDMYSSVLTIKSVSERDYGSFTCRSANEEGHTQTMIHLQRKGRPDPPTNVMVIDSGKDFVDLEFERGFDGGFPDANVTAIIFLNGEKWSRQCERETCHISGLQQNSEHTIQLMAANPLGISELSSPVSTWTAIDPDAIASPIEVFVQETSGIVIFSVPDIPTQVVGKVEVLHPGSNEWYQIPVEVQLENGKGRYHFVSFQKDSQVRVQLCISGSIDLCGPYTSATSGENFPERLLAAGAMQSALTIIIGVVVAIAAIVIIVIFVFCCCCKKDNRKSKMKNKSADMDVSHRGVGAPQAPPPPYYTVGLENKGLDGSIDKGLESDPAKVAMCGSPYGGYYNTHGSHSNHNGGINTLDNSYSNSNNGGSVNSQDSLWHVKAMNGDPNDPRNYQADPNDPRNYQYNPMVHGGYAMTGYDDYAQYPYQEDYQIQQNYNIAPNPYGTHPPRPEDQYYSKKDQYDANGMPEDPNYHQQRIDVPDGDAKPPHISFDESLESGFSTPNSKNRRIIREIIV